MKEISPATIWLEIRDHWKRLALAVVAIIAAVALVLAFDVDVARVWDEARTWLENLNDFAFFLAISVLPVAGFSITLVYVATGAKFGALTGMGVVAAATAAHLLLTHLVARSVLERPLRRFFNRRGYELPHYSGAHDLAFVTLAALVPGPPYAVRNHLLALSGVPLRRYFALCWFIYVVRSYVAIFVGGWDGETTRTQFAIVGVVWLVKFSICALVVQRLLRQRHSRSS